MGSGVTVIARVVDFIPEITIVSVDIDSGAPLGTDFGLVGPVVVLSLQKELSSFVPVIVDHSAPVDVDHRDRPDLVPLEHLHGFRGLSHEALENLENSIEVHLDTGELSGVMGTRQQDGFLLLVLGSSSLLEELGGVDLEHGHVEVVVRFADAFQSHDVGEFLDDLINKSDVVLIEEADHALSFAHKQGVEGGIISREVPGLQEASESGASTDICRRHRRRLFSKV